VLLLTEEAGVFEAVCCYSSSRSRSWHADRKRGVVPLSSRCRRKGHGTCRLWQIVLQHLQN